MSSGSGKQSRAKRVEAVKAAQDTLLNGVSMPSHFDERQVRIYLKYITPSKQGKTNETV